MNRIDWDKVAKDEFDSLPTKYKKDWADLRERVYGE